MFFKWKCQSCGTENEKVGRCSGCRYEPNFQEIVCIHGMAVDMACDDCGRTGFRFDGVNMPEDMTAVNQVAQEILDELSADGPGFRCERLKGKTTSEEAWRAIHNPHKDSDAEFDKVYNEAQPSSYRLFRWVCPCGASLQSMEELEGVD